MKDKKKYQILVLSDLKENTENILKSTVSFAKIIEADIHFFHAKKPTEIIKNDNQLSAKRAINEESFIIDKKIKKLIKSHSKEININHSFSIGNVKREIGTYLSENKPNLVVLGKRKSTSLSFLGDNITKFVLQKHKGSVIISSENDVLEPHKKLNLGFLNTSNDDVSISLARDLKEKSKEPIKYFRIVKKTEDYNKTLQKLEKEKNEFVFEENDTTVKNISKYLSKSNVNLLCLTKNKKTDNNSAIFKKIINDSNVSLLLTV